MNRPANTRDGAAITALTEQARQLARAGRAADAATLWQRVLAADPDRTEALLALSIQALARKDAAAALAMLEHAAASAPRDPMVQVYQALALKELGRPDEELAAVTRAQAIDPYFYPALLHKGMLLERLGRRRQAARTFKNLLKIVPDASRAEPGSKQAIAHAEAAILEDRFALERHLDGVLADLRRKHAGARLERFEQSLQIMIGAKKRYAPDPAMLFFPELPPIQFYDDALFPWLPELEAATDEIREELMGVLAEGRAEFRPYVQHPPSAPLAQWAELNQSPRWSTYFLWEHGHPVEAHCERCPRTAGALGRLPMARLPNFSPTAMFSCLEARTTIPPHTGETNSRLIVHLPLIVPPDCWFRVGNETREWQYGKAFVFDDSIEHEAHNGSDELRVVLIFDVWNPFLSEAERELVGGLINAVRDYYRAET